MRSASQKRDEVRVGGDGGAVDLDVVAGVRDDRQVVADEVEHAAGELRAAGAAGEDDDRPGSSDPGDADAGVRLVLMFTEISSAVSDSVTRDISSRPASIARRPSIAPISSIAAVFGSLAVAADEHVLVELVAEVGERRRR